jgi:hypothetical protein
VPIIKLNENISVTFQNTSHIRKSFTVMLSVMENNGISMTLSFPLYTTLEWKQPKTTFSSHSRLPDTTLDTVSKKHLFQILITTLAILTDIFHDFQHSFQAKVQRSQTFYFKSFPPHSVWSVSYILPTLHITSNATGT